MVEKEEYKGDCVESNRHDWEDDPIWDRLARRSLPEPPDKSKREILAFAREVELRRRAAAAAGRAKKPAPWWMALLEPCAAAFVLVAAVSLLSIWGLRNALTEKGRGNGVWRQATESGRVEASDAQVLHNVDLGFVRAHYGVSRVLLYDNGGGARLDRDLRRTLNSTYILHKETLAQVYSATGM
ncbi:hypothetical protein JW916_03245 [Candidatus Sumerlaeota bacterium]|nr:hypothetical protein [Candidatus Sumerlaeota bacterium]